MKKIELPDTDKETGCPSVIVLMDKYYTPKGKEVLGKVLSYLRQTDQLSGLNNLQEKLKEALAQEIGMPEITPPEESPSPQNLEAIHKTLMITISLGYHLLRLLWMAEEGIKERGEKP